ncbi:MAG: alpha-D-ribose 1-methylphosphonate 5-triphosphate diphosphatase [Sulfitobacter sp.]|jgi:alpha-D-ribose 1-methylphosphonate 5-triphosphate diphosphatase|uniref:alpha-D-ribose 1-methylphosphonate 5-triphosphate diphosphatase n=1 Tax=Sulfitobacter sp. TaxID=1903071 RepID=UPI000C0C61AE|nr:phosphonate metabolism protein PhnM [Roseobacter sp.]MBV49001.1 phosphonate metabolism protein PhnM [Roseobacter sp.]PHR05576.1 MAG: phosphonate metabolism protein PhnM [Sulfitobacter sp.]|tara:strand:- start:1122 stop:2264 length:1143 start_codon:yes stop_codon:yes gene_type:complete
MTQEITFANATLILKETVVTGAIRLRDGMISDITTGTSIPKDAYDMEGDYIAAGLVELHTDNLERHMTPRPKVDWPHRAAIMAHDRELAGAGITTVFDAIRVGSIISDGNRYQRYARAMADEILWMRDAGALRISHHIHLRAEVCSETLQEELAEFGPQDRIGIVSMMDHTPGQRQFRDLTKFEAYMRGKHSFGEAEFLAHVDYLYSLQKQFGAIHEAATVAAAAHYGAALASHDDTTAAQVDTSHSHGVKLAEFPTTLEAAQACHARGIATIMGAPNVIRGGSHSGNVAALDLAQADRLDILSSDYVPAGLLMAALQLGDLWGNLARGLATVTHAPALHSGLSDRGTLEIGMRADIIRFKRLDGLAILKETWSEGQRVF